MRKAPMCTGCVPPSGMYVLVPRYSCTQASTSAAAQQFSTAYQPQQLTAQGSYVHWLRASQGDVRPGAQILLRPGELPQLLQSSTGTCYQVAACKAFVRRAPILTGCKPPSGYVLVPRYSCMHLSKCASHRT